MRSFIFLFRDDNGNNAFFQIESNSFNDAWKAFCAEHSGNYYALIEGSNMEMREFLA